MISAGAISFLVHFAVTGAFVLRILYRKLEVNTALAWIVVLIAAPIAGPVAYILFGDHSLGRRRVRLGRQIRAFYQDAYALEGGEAAPAEAVPPPFGALARAIGAESGFPVLSRNGFTILTDPGDTFERMRRDIDAARVSCRLEFYVLDPAGRVEQVLEAVLRAAARGVACQILADAYGSKQFFRSRWPRRLAAGGVEVAQSLPGGLLRTISKRADLRNHRKLMICDRLVAYTGSANLVDPALFKADRKVGRWIDVMMRVEGPVVDALTCVFDADFLFEQAPSDLAAALRSLPPDGRERPSTSEGAPMQLLPSGPEAPQSMIHQFMIAAIFNARRWVRIVTPYFIPDQAMTLALTSAARSGVAVQVIVPERLDTRIGQYASEASYEGLMAAGVEIRRFPGGLLHAKLALIDDGVSVFGTANMDPRSFYLNLELSLLIYDLRLNGELGAVLDGFAASSHPIELEAWRGRSQVRRFLENLTRLAAPLL